jgi:hypothetical protein
VNKATSRRNLANRGIPAIIAVGSSLAALPASALELGEMTVQSRLGQPLRASVAFALAPNEQLSDYCVTMRPGPSVSGLPGVGAATVSVANGVIMLTGRTPVREPMVSAHVVVNCPYSANLSREYMLFIDPLISTQSTTATLQTTPQAEPIAIAPTAIERPVMAVAAEPAQKDIGTATSYQVQAGESLSMIAQRIENRSVGLWPAVNAIFAANPDAFMNNDPNQLKAGSWLSIPDFDGSVAIVAKPEPIAVPVAEVSAAYEPTPVVEATTEEIVLEEPALIEEPIAIEEPVADMTNDLQPGDIILDTKLEGPTTASSSPNVPVAIITTNNVSTGGTASPSWLIWLAGSGVALVFGLLMFGRRLRDRFGKPPAVTQTDHPQRRFSDTQTTATENIEALGVDYDLSDDSPTEENLVLDADLVIGTGLDQSATAGDSEDFGFAATTKLDIELPFEPVAQLPDETDMLPPLRTDEHSILESEVLPEDDDDDYDMSVIVDATKIPRPEDVTERDLKAVEIPRDDETLIAENYTISKEVDYTVIEQDYEDEMTATQTLNAEIARAASELAERMESSSDDNETTALPLATVTELDITAQMPGQNDDISDLDDTGVNEAITVNTAADDETVEIPAESSKVSS